MAQPITNRLGGGLFVRLHQRRSKRSCTIRRRVSPGTEAIFENCRHAWKTLFLTLESYLDRFHWIDQVRESAAVGDLMSYGADFIDPVVWPESMLAASGIGSPMKMACLRRRVRGRSRTGHDGVARVSSLIENLAAGCRAVQSENPIMA